MKSMGCGVECIINRTVIGTDVMQDDGYNLRWKREPTMPVLKRMNNNYRKSEVQMNLSKTLKNL